MSLKPEITTAIEHICKFGGDYLSVATSSGYATYRVWAREMGPEEYHELIEVFGVTLLDEQGRSDLKKHWLELEFSSAIQSAMISGGASVALAELKERGISRADYDAAFGRCMAALDTIIAAAREIRYVEQKTEIGPLPYYEFVMDGTRLRVSLSSDVHSE